MLPHNFNTIKKKAYERLLKLYYDAKSGHIGGSMSCLDFLLVLYHLIITPNDRFILSKGHAAGAWYVSLWSRGIILEETLATFCKEGTILPGHPSGKNIPGLLFPTGSLGHGPSLSCCMALGLKRKNLPGRIFCLCSEGDWQEGASWEALNFAGRHKLDNLTFILDQNKLQAFGTTEEVMGILDHTQRFLGFEPSVYSVNGHEPSAIYNVLSQPPNQKPTIIILNTIKGLWLPFEGKLESHYLPLTDNDYKLALDKISEKIPL